MLIKKPADVASSEITPKRAYLSRRTFMAGAAAAGAGAAAGAALVACALAWMAPRDKTRPQTDHRTMEERRLIIN